MGLRVIIFIVLSSFLGLFSCGKNENSFELRYDGENLSAPLLESGLYTGAVKFPSAELERFSGKELTKITFYTLETPVNCELRVFKNPTNTSFGDVLYQSVVETKEESWNTHELRSAIAIPTDELWIGISFSHSEPLSVLGCDAGPAKSNGDWVFTGDSLQPLNSFRSDLDINWNIRGFVE